MSGRAQGRMKLKIGDVELSLDANSLSFEGGAITSPYQARMIGSAFMHFAKAKEELQAQQRRVAEGTPV